MQHSTFSIKTFVKNVGSGWVALLVSSLVGLVTLPLSMKYLGKELYGISAITNSLFLSFQFLSVGLPPTILRFFSLAYAKQDKKEVREVLSVSIVILGSLGFLGTLGLLLFFPQFQKIYSISDKWRNDLLFLYLVVAFHFLQMFFLIPYYALVQAQNRYDLTNYRRTFVALLKLSTLWLGFQFMEPSLKVLAYSNICGLVYELASILWIAFRLDGCEIVPKFQNWSNSLAKQMLSFSVDNLIKNIFYNLANHLPVLIMGATLGKEALAFFVPSLTISSVCSSVLGSISRPLTPLASADKVSSNGNNIGRWAIIICELSAFVGGLLVVGFGVMGSDFLTLWLDSSFAWTSPILCLMVLSEVYQTIQYTNYSLALGSSSIKPDAYSSVVMALFIGTGLYFGTKYCNWSLLDATLCIFIVRTLRSAYYLLFSYAKLLRFSFWNCFWRAYVKPTILICCLLLLFPFSKKILPQYQPNILTLCIGSLCITFVYCLFGWYFILSNEIKTRIPFIKKFSPTIHKLLMIKY